jgi:proteasome lid subunit RPN8/RPN11
MSLRVNDRDLASIYSHGESTFPEECCGVMIGRALGDDRYEVVEIIAATNEREDESRHNRFLISPQILLQAQRDSRARGLDVLGYYHSHPDHPARPSEFDREHAWPGTSYLIVSVLSGRVADCRSWRLRADRTAFEEETVLGENGDRVTVEPAS